MELQEKEITKCVVGKMDGIPVFNEVRLKSLAVKYNSNFAEIKRILHIKIGDFYVMEPEPMKFLVEYLRKQVKFCSEQASQATENHEQFWDMQTLLYEDILKKYEEGVML